MANIKMWGIRITLRLIKRRFAHKKLSLAEKIEWMESHMLKLEQSMMKPIKGVSLIEVSKVKIPNKILTEVIKPIKLIYIQPARLSDIQRHPALDPIIPAIAPMIVDANVPGGYRVGAIAKMFSEEPKEVVEWYVALERMTGYAEYEIESLDVNKPKVILRANWSAQADSYDREVDYPVCFLATGITEGAMSAIFDKEMACEETHCKAKGDDYCRFVVRPKKG